MLSRVTAKGFFFYCVSLSVFLQLFLLPVLGAIADSSRLKKRLLGLTAAMGSASTCLLFFVGAPLDFRWGGLLFVVANLSLGATSVLHNSFLPEIATPDRRDRVSSRGYALGYLGGGLLLAANLAFMAVGTRFGLSTEFGVRISLLSAGLWWAGFSLIALRRLRQRAPAVPPSGRAPLLTAIVDLGDALRELGRRRHTRRFLAAYLLFNDGVHTVSAVASVFLAQELFVGRGRPVDQTFLLGVMLMVQFVGFVGAIAFERIAARTGAKRALVLSLILWCGAVVYCWGVLDTTAQAAGAAAVMAMVLGGSQALSRSLFSCMIPPGREAAFFSLYEVTNSGTSWIGPFLFAAVVGATNSYREALLSLIVLFVGGLAILVLTDTRRAIDDAGQLDRVPGPLAPALSGA
ncbi:MAG: MFS transporter [Acidobacteria bacterium]|nr:MAG: MFS transporter [Acidobacteriota bacterium]